MNSPTFFHHGLRILRPLETRIFMEDTIQHSMKRFLYRWLSFFFFSFLFSFFFLPCSYGSLLPFWGFSFWMLVDFGSFLLLYGG